MFVCVCVFVFVSFLEAVVPVWLAGCHSLPLRVANCCQISNYCLHRLQGRMMTQIIECVTTVSVNIICVCVCVHTCISMLTHVCVSVCWTDLCCPLWALPPAAVCPGGLPGPESPAASWGRGVKQHRFYQTAEGLGNRAITLKVDGLIPGRAIWRCVLGQCTSPYLLGECPCTYCKSLWIRVSA